MADAGPSVTFLSPVPSAFAVYMSTAKPVSVSTVLLKAIFLPSGETAGLWSPTLVPSVSVICLCPLPSGLTEKISRGDSK